MLAWLCRVVLIASVLGAAPAAAQPSLDELDEELPPGFEDRPRVPSAEPLVAPIGDAMGWGTLATREEPATFRAAWRVNRGVVTSGAVALTVGYLLGLGLGTLDVAVQAGGPCDDQIGALHAVPIFGAIAGWVMLGTCRTHIEPMVHGVLELFPAVAQSVGFVVLMIGAAGHRSGVGVAVNGTGLSLTARF